MLISAGQAPPFNIDAKLNGAYIVMGLLYGEGDPMKTLEITTRCGQDSDCNPSNAMAVLGVIKGFSGLPDNMQEGVKAISDSVFIIPPIPLIQLSAAQTSMHLISLLKDGGKVTDKR